MKGEIASAASAAESSRSTEQRTHVELLNTLMDSFYTVVKEELAWPPRTALDAVQEGDATHTHVRIRECAQQYRRAVFLEDPTNSVGHFNAEPAAIAEDADATQNRDPIWSTAGVCLSDVAIQNAVEAVKAIKAHYIPKEPRATHLKPVSYITGKLQHLIDLRVIVSERISADQFQSASVANWSFFILSDETGSVVAGFPPDLPPSVKRLVANFKNPTSRNAPTLHDVFAPSRIVALYAIKTMSLMGCTVSVILRTSH